MARAPCIEEHKENGVSKEEQEKKDSKFFFLTETKPRLERKRTPRIAKTASIFFFYNEGGYTVLQLPCLDFNSYAQ